MRKEGIKQYQAQGVPKSLDLGQANGKRMTPSSGAYMKVYNSTCFSLAFVMYAVYFWLAFASLYSMTYVALGDSSEQYRVIQKCKCGW